MPSRSLTCCRNSSGVPFGRTCWVSQPPPLIEDQTIAELLLEPARLHIGCRGLDRIENVDTGFDQVRDEVLLVNRAATMKERLHPGVRMHPAAQRPVMRFEHLGPESRTNKLAALGAGVVEAIPHAKQ